MNVQDTVKVFVYGTLKVDGSLATGMDGARVNWYNATTKGCLYHNCRYPFMVESNEATDIVQGEVHVYPDWALRKLDLIEGYNPDNPECGIGYIRRKITVKPDKFDEEEVWAYVWGRKLQVSDRLIINGVWSESYSAHHV